MRSSIKIGHRSDVGRIRSVNEDSFCVLVSPTVQPGIDAVLAVADGIGGHQAGQVASKYVMEALYQRFSKQNREELKHDTVAPNQYGVLLRETIETLNLELYNLGSSKEELDGMGTTIVAAIITGPLLFVSHVGDSRAYLVRQNRIERLTQDHSVVNELVRSGLIRAEETKSHPMRNVITKSLGSTSKVKVDSVSVKIMDVDSIVMCTDGLTNMLTDEEILQSVIACNTPDVACRTLVGLANRHGGSDNITVIVANVEKVRSLRTQWQCSR